MSFGGGGASRSQSESSGSKSSSSEVQRGFPEAQSKFLSEFFEPKLREFAIPYAESRFLGKPITRTKTIPGTPERTIPASTRYEEREGGPPGAVFDVLHGSWVNAADLDSIGARNASVIPAVPERTETETIGFEPASRTFPRLSTGGLFDEQRRGAIDLGNYALSRLGGIPSASIGESGLLAAAPGLFDLIGRQVEQDVLKPEEQRQLNVQDLLAAIKLGVQGVGGSGSSVGQSFGTSSNSNFGFRVSGGKAGQEGGTRGGYGV